MRENRRTVLQKYLDAFAWTPSDMLGIDMDFLRYRLALDLNAKPIK